jgi:hypothetical protein
LLNVSLQLANKLGNKKKMVKKPTMKQGQANGNRNMALFSHVNAGVDAALRSQKKTTMSMGAIYSCVYITA